MCCWQYMRMRITRPEFSHNSCLQHGSSSDKDCRDIVYSDIQVIILLKHATSPHNDVMSIK